jgi:hypothetical protein
VGEAGPEHTARTAPDVQPGDPLEDEETVRAAATDTTPNPTAGKTRQTAQSRQRDVVPAVRAAQAAAADGGRITGRRPIISRRW